MGAQAKKARKGEGKKSLKGEARKGQGKKKLAKVARKGDKNL